MTIKKNIVLAAAIAGGILILDMLMPIGYAVYLLYLVPIFIAAPALQRQYILFLPAIGTLLTLASYFLAPPGGNLTRAMVNRGLGVLALWSISFLLVMRRRVEEALEQSYRLMEKHIHERTAELKQANHSLQLEISERKQAEENIKTLNVLLEERIGDRTAELEAANGKLLLINNQLSRLGEDLRESQQQLIRIIDFFPDPTFVIDSQKKVIVWNSAMETMTGVSKTEMLGQGDRAYSIPFYGERRRQLLDLLDQTDDELAAKYEAVRKKGGILYAETFCPALYGGKGAYVWATVAPLVDAHGNRVGAIESIRDTTDRKKSEEALRTSEARFRSYFNLPLTGIAILSQENKWIEVNDRLCDILGYSRQELLLTTWAGLTYPEDLSADIKQFNNVLAGQLDRYTLEKRFVRRGGEIIWASLAVGCVRRIDGSPDYIIALVQDITANKQAKSQRDLLAAAIESAADAVVVTDTPYGAIQYVNKAFEHITGYSRDEVIGKNLHLLDSGKQDAQFFKALSDSLIQNGVWTGQLINKKKDGTLYHEACACFTVLGDAGNISNYVAIKRDVTDKLKFEAIAESVTAMDNIGYIFSGVRHELGNAINTLMMTLELLESKLDTSPKETMRRYVGQSIGQVEKMSDLLKSLKNYNTDESLELRNVQVSFFLDNFLSLVAEGFKRKGIELETSAAPDADRVYADPRALQQVLLNIFTNAADAVRGSDNPKIILRVVRLENMVKFSVADNGCGMTAEQQKNLFKPLFTSKTHGTGLGMVIVKKMLTQMKGLIEIESRKDHGTTVNFFIPRGDPSEADTQ